MTKTTEGGGKATGSSSTAARPTTTTTTTSSPSSSAPPPPSRPASQLKRIATNNFRVQREQGGEAPLAHDGNNASIVLDEQLAAETPWTPKSLGRAKTAIIYKVEYRSLSRLPRPTLHSVTDRHS